MASRYDALTFTYFLIFLKNERTIASYLPKVANTAYAAPFPLAIDDSHQGKQRNAPDVIKTNNKMFLMF